MVFDAPWESRAFGMAAVMQEQGRWTWEEFGVRLGEWPSERATYYERWVAALEELLIEQGILTDEEIDVRAEEFAQGLLDHH
jgi:nitrile hydratase accessory protein